jgi:hypothetical protein
MSRIPKKVVGTASGWQGVTVVKMYQNYVSRRVLVHQSFDFCENLICSLLVLSRKSGMDLDTSRDIRKENRVERHEMEAQVGQNSQPVKYSVSGSCQCL